MHKAHYTAKVSQRRPHFSELHEADGTSTLGPVSGLGENQKIRQSIRMPVDAAIGGRR